MPIRGRSRHNILRELFSGIRRNHFGQRGRVDFPLAASNPHTVRLHYFGKIADANTNLLRNAGLAGVLSRSTAHKANLVNALGIAEQRGWGVVERHDKRSVHTDSIRVEVESDTG